MSSSVIRLIIEIRAKVIDFIYDPIGSFILFYRSSQMNDVNSDFATRSKFHQTQTHTVEGNQFQK